MRKFVIYGMLAISAVSLAFMGFQCSSAEMTSAKLYIQRKEYDNAEAQLQKEIAKNPQNEEAYYLLGREIYYPQKKYRDMADAFRKALAIAPTHQQDIKMVILQSWGTTFNQGVADLNKAEKPEEYDVAINAFKLCAYLEPDSILNQQNLGLSYFRKGDYDSAITPLKMAIDKGKSLLAIKTLSTIYLSQASNLISKFNEANRDHITLKQNLAKITEGVNAEDVKYYIGQPESKKEETKGRGKKKVVVQETWSYPQYNLTLVIKKNVISAVTYSSPYTVSIDSSDYQSAMEAYNKAIDVLKNGNALYPEDADISESLMNAYIGAQKNNEARELLVMRIKKYPDSKFDRYNYGVFLLKDNEFKKAIDEFKAALSIDTSFSSAIYNIAATYVNWGVAIQDSLKNADQLEDKSYQEKFKEALPYLERVLVEKPNDIQIWELVGQVYANLGNTKKATEAYDKADRIRQGKN